MWRRAPGYFDVVAYDGGGVSNYAVNHNLGVVPEMIWIKRRNGSVEWVVYHKDGGAYEGRLNQNSYFGYDYTNGVSATTFTLSYAGNETNQSGGTYIAYLFASVDGISKVGSYTGTGNDLNVDCGFSAGARFILIKRTDSTGDWYLWNSTRGIVAGDDPYVLLNSDANEITTTDYIDPLASGFTVTSSAPAALNASGGNYIFYAIA